MSTIRFRVEDDSSFALPSPERDGKEPLGWRLRYGDIDQTDRQLLASIITSYEALLCSTDRKARLVRRAFRNHRRKEERMSTSIDPETGHHYDEVPRS